MIKLILLLFITIILVIYYFYWVKAFIISAPYLPSNNKFKSYVLKLADKYKIKNAVELGSGDGRISLALANNKKRTVTAIEINPILTILIWIRRLISKKKNLKIIRGNFLRYDFKDCDFAILYLYPKVMKELEIKLFKEMKPGSIIVSNIFSFPNKKPIEKIDKFLVYKVE